MAEQQATVSPAEHEHRWKTVRITETGRFVQSCRRSKCQTEGVYRVVDSEDAH